MTDSSPLSHGGLESHERDNFFKLTLLVFRDGNEKLRQFFKSQWPVVYQNKTGSSPPSSWTDIPNDAAEMKKIETKPLKFQFKDQETQFSSGNTKTWDFTLLTKILKDSTLNFITPSTPESDAIKELKEIRDKLIGHAPDAKIPIDVFNTEWPKACNALNVFGLTQKEIDQVIEDVRKPAEILIPILKEILKSESEILDAVKNLEERNQVRHEETITIIKQGSEDVKDTIRQQIGKLSEPKRCCSENIRITEAHAALLDARLKHFNDVIATDLLDMLPCLSQEQKDLITYNERNFTRQTALKTLFDIIKTCENGFEKLVKSLVEAGYEHDAVLLDHDCQDIKIPVRFSERNQIRRDDIEAKIAKKYISSSSEDCKELRKAFSRVLPKGVHFVHTKQFGEGPGNNDTAFVFRISKEQAVDDMNRIHTDGTLSAHIKKIINLQSLATDINVELLYEESDFRKIKKILSQDGSTDLVLETTTEDHDQSGSSSNRSDHSANNGSRHESSSGYNMSNNYQDPTQRNQPGETSYQSLSHTTQRSTAPSSSQSGSAGLPSSQSRSTATPTDESGLPGPSPSQSGSAGLPPSQSGSTTTPTDESGLPDCPPPSQPGPAVCNNRIKDILCKSESVVDILTSMLDTDYKLLQNHRHLADYLNAPPDIKQKCNCPTIHSCTLVMLELPHIQDITVKTLREKVKAVGRNDVLNLIDQRIPSESRSKTIKEALNEEVMDEIAIKLDQPSSRIRQNWKDVGKRLKIDPDDLDQIERGESNPAKELLEYAYISVDPTRTTSGKFREIIMGFKDRTDLHNLVEDVGITQDSDLNRPLKEVIPPDSPNMKKMAAYLNRSPSGLSNWKQLAFAWGLGCDQFKPQPPQSPTKGLLDWMCTEDHVTTVDQFLDILGVKMKRYDVKEELEKKIQKVLTRLHSDL